MPVTEFGRIYAPDTAWLTKAPAEEILDPDLPIIDTHHHLWDRPDNRYLLNDLIADFSTGHHIVATVFLQCHAMYRAHGPVEMRPVGETEFVASIGQNGIEGAHGSTYSLDAGTGLLTINCRLQVCEQRVKSGC